MVVNSTYSDKIQAKSTGFHPLDNLLFASLAILGSGYVYIALTKGVETALIAMSIFTVICIGAIRVLTRKRTLVPDGYNSQVVLPHTEEVELYHNAISLCSQQVRMALVESGVKFKEHHIHLLETGWYQTISPEYFKINPAGVVPLLVHNGHPIHETKAIVEYINKHFAPPGRLSPSDSQMIQVADYWISKGVMDVDAKGGPILDESKLAEKAGSCLAILSLVMFVAGLQEIPFYLFFHGIIFHPMKVRLVLFLIMRIIGRRFLKLPKAKQGMDIGRRVLRNHCVELESHLKQVGGPFICGSQFTHADIMIVVLFERMRFMDGLGHLMRDLPHVKRFWEATTARQSYTIAIVDQHYPILDRTEERIREWKKLFDWEFDEM